MIRYVLVKSPHHPTHLMNYRCMSIDVRAAFMRLPGAGGGIHTPGRGYLWYCGFQMTPRHLRYGVDLYPPWVRCARTGAVSEKPTLGIPMRCPTEEDTILALTMGLDKPYKSFIISLDTTPPEQLTLEHVISCMLNEEVHCDNVEIQGVGVKCRGMNGEKGEVRVKKEENVALAATHGDRPTVCWCCSKPGHIKAFCKENPIQGQGSDQENMAMAAIGIDSDDEYLTEMTDSK